MPNQALLPEGFTDLEPFVDAWALETDLQRLHKRMQSTMLEIESFYRAILPHLEIALNYLDDFEFEQLTLPQQRLYRLALAAAEASLSVEVYGAPTLPIAPDISRFHIDYSKING